MIIKYTLYDHDRAPMPGDLAIDAEFIRAVVLDVARFKYDGSLVPCNVAYLLLGDGGRYAVWDIERDGQQRWITARGEGVSEEDNAPVP